MSKILEKKCCANHHDRAGCATCMACKKVICQECATSWDGINYCVNCLSALNTESAKNKYPLIDWLLLLAAIGGLFYLSNSLMVWFSTSFLKWY